MIFKIPPNRLCSLLFNKRAVERPVAHTIIAVLPISSFNLLRSNEAPKWMAKKPISFSFVLTFSSCSITSLAIIAISKANG